eukprot:tig00020675_g12663.t1
MASATLWFRRRRRPGSLCASANFHPARLEYNRNPLWACSRTDPTVQAAHCFCPLDAVSRGQFSCSCCSCRVAAGSSLVQPFAPASYAACPASRNVSDFVATGRGCSRHTPHENTWDCFVSYAHVDAAVVFRYCDLLQAAGIKIWVDRELKAGQRWMLKIAEAMERCKSFICFLSPAYLSSKNCDDEMLFAHELRIPKFPVWLVDWKSIALRADYRMMLSSVNWTEQCKYGEGDDAVNKAAGALIEGLREELPKY